MAKDKTKKRLRRAAKKLRKQAQERARRGPSPLDWPDIDWPDAGRPDAGRPDDPEGGAGVREPRRPRPAMPAAALALAAD